MNIHCAHTRLVPLSELDGKRNPKNPNTHSAAQIAAIAAVFEANGIRAPIVVSNLSGLITKGHGRLEAAFLLGYESFPVDFQDYADANAELSDMLADNHLAELSEIDDLKLVDVLKELQAAGHDIGAAGFSEEELAALTEIAGDAVNADPVPQMEMQAFEHYDYLMFVFRDLRDWLRVIQLMKIGKVNFNITRKAPKIGIGRVINGKHLLGRLENPACNNEPGTGGEGIDTPVDAVGDVRSA